VKAARAFFCHPVVLRLLGIVIGITLVYASLDKIRYPDRFADMVHDYDMLPMWSVNAFALVLPR